MEFEKEYIETLKSELVPAMGCTEPIAIAYCASKAKTLLSEECTKILVEASGNIIKNVKSVTVPNTGGLKGIEAAAAIGVIAGNADKKLEVIAKVSDAQKIELKDFLKTKDIQVQYLRSNNPLDIIVTLFGNKDSASVRIAGSHDHIIMMKKNDDVLYQDDQITSTPKENTDTSFMSVEGIYEFAQTVNLDKVRPTLERQIRYNMTIAECGMKENYGANIGKVLMNMDPNGRFTRVKAYAAAGSDARMSGCELPVIINSGSGNQGMTASIPVIIWAQDNKVDQDLLYRSLCVSNLITIHLKHGIGKLSAYCGVVSAGVGAACGICFMDGGDLKAVAHTLVNAIAMISGTVCDGAKPSCAAKIANAVEAGLLGYEMYRHGQQFRDGEGIVTKGVENTIRNISLLAKEGMQETDKEIIEIMTGKC